MSRTLLPSVAGLRSVITSDPKQTIPNTFLFHTSLTSPTFRSSASSASNSLPGISFALSQPQIQASSVKRHVRIHSTHQNTASTTQSIKSPAHLLNNISTTSPVEKIAPLDQHDFYSHTSALLYQHDLHSHASTLLHHHDSTVRQARS